jgi:alpha-ribazole phosphatase
VFPFDPSLEGKRLYLMRHGKTYEPRMDSPAAGPDEDEALPLTEDGRRDVVATAQAMAHLDFEAAYSSTFHRSHDTARIVAEPHGLTVATRPELVELRVYPPGGGTMLDTARRYIAIAREAAKKSPHEIELETGGTLGELVERASSALHECLAQPGQRVLVVAHGGINRLLLTQLLDIPLARFLSIDQDFACINVIEFVRGGRPWVRALNCTVLDPLKGHDIGI